MMGLLLFSCSTENNTFLSRTYHGTTAHYNGYFNANDLLTEAINGYRASKKEDYYNTLEIRPLPAEKEVSGLLSPIDTAVAKCTKVIQRHAMPSVDDMSKKKAEHNNWIDENWLTIGIANFYKRDYEQAAKSFDFSKKFFKSDKSTYIAAIWIARTQIQQNKLVDAVFTIDALDKAVEMTKERKKEEGFLGLKKKKLKKGEVREPSFPKKWMFDLEITRAMLFERKKENEKVIEALEKALKFARKSADKARIHFILGQRFEQAGDKTKASEHYAAVLKKNANFEMAFNARLKNALNGNDAEVRAFLLKMLKDAKNADFVDQIYFTLGQIEEREENIEEAQVHYTNCAFYSTTNVTQKGMAYERLGDISFAEKDYVRAQKYFDSCVTVIPENYPKAEIIKNKATKLLALVTAIETATNADSLLRIVDLNPEDQLKFAEKTLKKLKEDEKRKKQQEAERLAALQEKALKAAGSSGSSNYWSNAKQMKEGADEFKRQWGPRENVDDWRRSERTIVETVIDTSSLAGGATSKEENKTASLDSLTPEMLLDKLPKGDSSINALREKMMSSYFDAGMIYQEQLNEKQLAIEQFEKVISKKFENNYKLSSAYQLYKLHGNKSPKGAEQREYILTNYPTSDYAGFLRDPDFFLKKKERDKEFEKDYLVDLDRYERQLYYPVIAKAEVVLETQKDNPLRAKYALLRIKAMAKVIETKDSLLPHLDTLIMRFPGTPEAKKAQEMKDILVNGFSKNEPIQKKSEGIFKFKEDVPMNVVVFIDPLKKDLTSSNCRTRVTEFNEEFFDIEKLNVISKVLGEHTILIIKEFENDLSANKYVETFRKTKKHLLDLQEAKVFFISNENLKTLFETQKVEEYDAFYEEFY